MAKTRYTKTYRRYAPEPRESNAPWFAVGLLCMIILLGIGLLHYRPDLFSAITSTSAPTGADTARTFPTLDTAALDVLRQNALRTAAENLALNQAIPTDDTSQPPLAPAAATAATINQGGLATTVPATSFSPVDTGYRPLPTPTTMLSQEQFDASQASEEQNFLNTSASGLTPAQRMVQEHEAEQRARQP